MILSYVLKDLPKLILYIFYNYWYLLFSVVMLHLYHCLWIYDMVHLYIHNIHAF